MLIRRFTMICLIFTLFGMGFAQLVRDGQKRDSVYTVQHSIDCLKAPHHWACHAGSNWQ